MRLLLTKAARIKCKPGDIVDISPEQAQFLLTVGAAELILDAVQRETPEAKAPKKTVRKATK